MNLPVPDFLIIGAAKSGTTSLISGLRQHPGIFAPGGELNYFSHHYDYGKDWYQSQFLQPGKIRGEKSTSYLYETACHERIHHHNPKMQLIVLLREPVRRAFSNWTMRYNQGRLLKQVHGFNNKYRVEIENIGFAPLFRQYMASLSDPLRRMEPLDIFERGRYIEQIDHLLSIFPKEQLLILISEDFFHSPKKTFALVSRFLQVDDFPQGMNVWKRQTIYPIELNNDIVQEIRAFYKPFNERLFEFLGREIEAWKIQ